MSKTYIHVNQHKIRANKVEINGPSRVVYGGNDKPLLSCGARVVIETESSVDIIK
jgi:hypothetical protein